MDMEIPVWLKELIHSNTAPHGDAYYAAIENDLLEASDWVVHLRDENNRSLYEDYPSRDAFFDKIFNSGMEKQYSDPENCKTVKIGGSRKLLVVSGNIIQETLKELGLENKYFWKPIRS
jgi:hypothetical protein